MKTVIFFITGGIGKNIAATAVLKAIKKKYSDRKIIVFCTYPDIFKNNPLVHSVQGPAQILLPDNIYFNFVKGNDVIYLSEDVYSSHQFLIEDKHWIHAWCECLGLQYNQEMPEIYFDEEEEKNILNHKKDKPILLLQTKATNSKDYNWTTDIPHNLIQDVVNDLAPKYDIYHIHSKTQKGFLNSSSVTTNNIREILFLIRISDKRLGVNSFMQHAAAALNLPSLIYWVFTPCKKYGYNIHNNIEPKDYNFEYYKNFEFFHGHVGYPDISNCKLNLNNFFVKEKIINNLR